MKFSQRAGITPIKVDLQTNSIDSDLRVGLWNVLQIFLWDNAARNLTSRSPLITLFSQLWANHFKLPLDTMPPFDDGCVEFIRERYFEYDWHEVYDFVEFVLQNSDENLQEAIKENLNAVLEKEISGYRIVDFEIIQITSVEETESIENALTNTAPFKGANAHLKSSLIKLSDKVEPDYRNSIKESISALESVCQEITGDPKATLGTALKALESRGTIHSALKNSFSALYGYTSDAHGIRHAMLDESKLTFIDAKYMLVSCTAFINYLIGKML